MRGVVVGSERDNWPSLRQALDATGRFASLRRFDPITDSQALSRMVRLYSPHLVILDLASYADFDSLLELVARANPPTLLVATGAGIEGQVLLQLMRVGVQEYLTLPYTREETIALLGRVEQKLAKQPVKSSFTELLFAWLPAKAGTGASTLAAQASMALAEQFHKKTLLVDLDLNSGLIAFLLRLQQRHSVAGVLQREIEFDEEFWDRLVLKRNDLDVLASTEDDSGSSIEPGRVVELLGVARRIYEVVCVDLSGEMEEHSVGAMQEAKHILLVCTPEAPVLHLARRRIARLRSLGLEDRVRIVVNRASSNGYVSVRQIPELLGQEVFATVRNDYGGVGEALISGRRIRPQSPLGIDVAALAARLANQPAAPVPPLGQLRKLFDRLSVFRSGWMGGRFEGKSLEPGPPEAYPVAIENEVASRARETLPDLAPSLEVERSPLTEAEFNALLDACTPRRKTKRGRGFSLHHCHAVLSVVRHTGMGFEEVLGLSVKDVDGARLRGIELTEALSADLRDFVRPGEGPLFLDGDGSVQAAMKTLRKRLAEYGHKAGIQGPVFERVCATGAGVAANSLRNLGNELGEVREDFKALVEEEH